MTQPNTQRLKIALGLLLGLAIGATCRVLAIPSPALAGALLVVSMTLGYIGMDRWTAREAKNRHLCGGPDGSIKGDV